MRWLTAQIRAVQDDTQVRVWRFPHFKHSAQEVRGGDKEAKHFQSHGWTMFTRLPTQEVESQHLGSLSSQPTSTFFLSPLPLTPSNCLFYPLACPNPAEDWKQQLSKDCWESTWMRIRKLILWLPRFPHVLRPVCHSSCMTESLRDVRHFLMEQIFLEELHSSKESFSQSRNGL